MDQQAMKSILCKAEEYIAAEQEASFRQEIQDLVRDRDWDGLYDRFYTELSFGTGGIRGVIGGGYTRINPYIIRKTTQGLADYILHHTRDAGSSASGSANASAVIAYDCRRFSDLFALETARVLCGNGIKTYLFSSLRPTPELSFGVRLLAATAGVVVTASHNPARYNGYKVYWEDGSQIIAPHDRGIISRVRDVRAIKAISREQALEQGLLIMIDKEVDEPFLRMVREQALRPDLVREKGGDLKVVYTPLHGTGAIFVPKALGEMGIGVTLVPDQAEPDGEFPTVEYPNPEEASALAKALALAREIRADLVMGTDPDSDRLGIAVPQNGDYVLISGNQLGVLLADYIFSTRSELGTLPDKPVLIKTIVTTDLQREIARAYGAECIDVLTGFKYIAAKIREFETSGHGREYVFGGEESYGYLVGTQVRDKDAVTAATMTAEMTLYHVSRGTSLIDRLEEIYREYGYFEELLVSKNFEGEEGFNAMKALMDRLRNDPPASWIGQNTVMWKDYSNGTTHYPLQGRQQQDIELPSSNVLQFVLADDTVITVRPSGTEPKIKFYASCRSRKGTDMEKARGETGRKIAGLRKAIEALI